MKRLMFVLAAIVLIVAGWWGFRTYLQPRLALPSTPAASDETETTPELNAVIWASGKLEPLTWAGLSPVISGNVAQIYVQEGDWVENGTVLLELNNEPLQSQVQVAQAALSEAQAARAKLLAGATPAQIRAAEAEVAAAEAGVKAAAGQMLEVQAAIDSARAQVSIAQRQYNELASHPNQAERDTAAADVAVAEAAIRQAQAAYNLVRGDPSIGALPESMHLYQTTAALDAAKARSTLATQGATPQELSVAAGAISAAQTQVAAAESSGPSAQAALQSAMARKNSAQAALDSLLAGATKEEIDMVEARVQSAEAAVASAESNLRQSQIKAPFAGQVGAIHLRLGELAIPGQAALLLGDTKQMHVETTDLRETDVARLRLAMPVEVTFDALPNRVFQGMITQIAPVSNVEKGSTNYTVHVAVSELDASLRWGMTAFVNIQAD